MKKEIRSCENCRHYKIYYTKGVCKFEAQKIGFCALFEKNLDKYDVCTAWKSDEARTKAGKMWRKRAWTTYSRKRRRYGKF